MCLQNKRVYVMMITPLSIKKICKVMIAGGQMSKQINEEQRIQNTIRFINATQELIDEISVENVSIRKIAARAGFHNSTLYLYFKDVDYLILLASMRYFEEYSRSLAELSTKNLSVTDRFFAVWTSFCHAAFAHPNMFYYFFFGKYSNNITPIMKEYYDLFPEKKYTFSSSLENMFYGNNIYDRNLQLLNSLTGIEDVRITENNVNLVNKISTSYFKDMLDRQRLNPVLSPKEATEDMLAALRYMIGYKN